MYTNLILSLLANLKNVFAFALFPPQDYFDIVKKPMDLSTIRKRLDTGLYTDPWEYVDHVWLMFSNAWVYNRKNSRVHKFCSKVCYNNFCKASNNNIKTKNGI